MGKADHYFLIYDLKAQNFQCYFSSHLFFYSHFSWTQTLRGENPLAKASHILDKSLVCHRITYKDNYSHLYTSSRYLVF